MSTLQREDAASHPSIWSFRDQNTGIWKWAVVGPLVHEIGKPMSGFWLEVEEGFVSNLVTIPVWLRWLIDRNDPQTARASIIHDYMLAHGFEQRMAAGEFYRALCEDGLPRLKRVAFYLAVLLASSNWDNELPLSVQEA